jgi:hypothetical protein
MLYPAELRCVASWAKADVARPCKKIMQDQLEGNILLTTTEGTGRDRRCRILGANLLKYLKGHRADLRFRSA